jgi:hypothetical protein
VSLPAAALALLASAPCAGFSGSRALAPASLAALGLAVAALPASASVVVGCAAGADQAALSAVVAAGGAPRLSVFAAFGPVSPPWPAAHYSAPGAWSGSAVAAVAAALSAGASVTWWAGGGPSVPLAGRLAARSVACVRAVAAAGGVWCSFPARPVPVGLVPAPSASRCFSGSGNGSWASLAFGLGLALPCLVFLPPDVPAPAGWPLVALGGGWWSAAPPAVQLALF